MALSVLARHPDVMGNVISYLDKPVIAIVSRAFYTFTKDRYHILADQLPGLLQLRQWRLLNKEERSSRIITLFQNICVLEEEVLSRPIYRQVVTAHGGLLCSSTYRAFNWMAENITLMAIAKAIKLCEEAVFQKFQEEPSYQERVKIALSFRGRFKESNVLQELHYLDLSGTQVSDAGVECLKDLKLLNHLNLSGTQVSDAGLEILKELPNLGVLDLSKTQVSDVGIEHLEGVTNLRILYLSNTQVSDKGLESLKGLTNLEWLYLNQTQVSDQGLESLRLLTNLVTIQLIGTQMSAGGLNRLRALLPNALISELCCIGFN